MNQLKQQHFTHSTKTVDSEAFADITESLLKRAKFSVNQVELDSIVAGKTAAYKMALEEVDSAKSLLNEIAANVSGDDKAALEAAVTSVDRLTMFQGDAAMNGNSQWENSPFSVEIR